MHKRIPARERAVASAVVVAGLTTGAVLAQSGLGDAEAAPQDSITISSTDSNVKYGETVLVAGRTAPGTAGRAVRLERAIRGAGFRPVATTRTRGAGAYRFAIKARSSAAYRTVSDTGAAAAPKRVKVAGALSARSTPHVLGGSARVRGTLKPGAGRRVAIQLATRKGWKTVERTRSRAGGHFRASWKPSKPGTYRLRARFGGDRTLAAASAPSWRVRSYRPAAASWYGPGLYGNKLGCGGTLNAGTLGVANKHLPCGSKVTLHYRGRTATVPVVDRGPYVGGREFDLTAATKARLGFGSTGTVWSTN